MNYFLNLKWKILSSLCCCQCKTTKKNEKQSKKLLKTQNNNDNNNSTNFCIKSSNQEKLYPPGRILHIVRKYPKNSHVLNEESIEKATAVASKSCYSFSSSKSKQLLVNNANSVSNMPVYQVIETNNEAYNELLISSRMIQDHMPDHLIKCMKAVLEEPAPKKPPRFQFNDQYIELCDPK
jgi:hypothetical protein